MTDRVAEIIGRVEKGEIGASEALEMLSAFPFQDLGYAKVDHHRALRQGMHEVIYCEGKSLEQVISIARELHSNGTDILGTRANADIYYGLKEIFPDIKYNEVGRVVSRVKDSGKRTPGLALVLTAGTSDIPVAEEARETLVHFNCGVESIYDVGVAGVHRLTEHLEKIRSADVIIVVAGMEGALPSLIGGLVSCPVIAVPTSVGYGSSFEGLSALLGMLNSCASGIAVVNIDNGFGAACIAYRILATRKPTYTAGKVKKDGKKRK